MDGALGQVETNVSIDWLKEDENIRQISIDRTYEEEVIVSFTSF